MSAGTIVCSGDIAVSPDGAPLCNGVWTLVPTPLPFDPMDLDPLVMGQFFSVGFAVVATFWAVSRMCKTLLDLLK